MSFIYIIIILLLLAIGKREREREKRKNSSIAIAARGRGGPLTMYSARDVLRAGHHLSPWVGHVTHGWKREEQ